MNVLSKLSGFGGMGWLATMFGVNCQSKGLLVESIISPQNDDGGLDLSLVNMSSATCQAEGDIARWDEQYNHLKTYRLIHKDRWPKQREEYPAGNGLGLWCYHQRQALKKGKLPPLRRRRLEAIRFPWDGQWQWMRQYKLLLKWRDKHPSEWPTCHCEWPPNNKLGNWCHSQRTMHKRGTLAPVRVDLLNHIEFSWCMIDEPTSKVGGGYW
jgi:hypothetical protein